MKWQSRALEQNFKPSNVNQIWSKKLLEAKQEDVYGKA